MKEKILVTGGAGYIGSHTVLLLNSLGYEVYVYDNLSSGHKEAVLEPAKLIVGELNDLDKLRSLLKEVGFDAIIHFAASIVVPESVSDPIKYYKNNTVNTLNLVNLAVEHGIKYFIFSSSAAVYGIPKKVPVKEEDPLEPINPYGRSKMMSEFIIEDVHRAFPDFRYVNIRYFNVAGADPEGRIGQSTPEATHLIKVACMTALGKKDKLYIYGDDYPTPDGTCIRDYIHVMDIAEAHIFCLNYLKENNPPENFNCGYGKGYSVKEVVETVEKVAGVKINKEITSRRPGDPPVLIADSTKLKSLGWKPKYEDLEFIVWTAYNWEKNRRY